MPFDGDPRLASRLDHRFACAGRSHVGQPRLGRERRHLPRRPRAPRARGRGHMRAADGDGVPAGDPRSLRRALRRVGQRHDADYRSALARRGRDALDRARQDGPLLLVQGSRAPHEQRHGGGGGAGQPERRALQRHRAHRRALHAAAPVLLAVRPSRSARDLCLYHLLVGAHRRGAGGDDRGPLRRPGVPRHRARAGGDARPLRLARRAARLPLRPKVSR
mmetsp:Transcript_3857/g.9749  ORF Transcript_3857/g.9749 Transcript_3857/m.9749 type:complete len:220 (-) Transcript_3857:371-1030(-)